MYSSKFILFLSITLIILMVLTEHPIEGMDSETKRELRLKVIEMFKHAYNSYMNNAFPADELMPLSCKGRYRGSEPSRGDVDDSLGNFSLSLIDSLDTLAVLGDIPEFERAINLVITTIKFDTDVIVSVFETNIRVLGGLLGGHVLATYLKKKKHAMDWYKDELLTMAKDIGTRLLPAFNTSTGIPYPRINLKHGINKDISANYRDTCTACAGTMILEFAALSRLTGDPVFEEKAHKAMDYLWNQRHRSSDLVGTVINIHNGDWIRRESGVGAGIDSYYEYVLKAYILLGDDTYLTRFNKHYDAVKKYISQGPRFVDVHMHRPQSTSRNFMDALLAFWPGLQVLKGDIQPAIEVHEMLYQVMQRHNFLPEAFTSDFHIHWGHHPLRPEFVESTYFLYKATGDPHYLDVGQKVVENLEQHARVPCGFAALKDVSKGTHEDQMDSFVLAETFKYLYLMFADKSDILFDVDDYIFTTEAHLLPLTLSRCNGSKPASMRLSREMYSHLQEMDQETHDHDEFGDSPHNTCPNPQVKFKINYVSSLRAGLKNLVNQSPPIVPASHQCMPPRATDSRLKATDFIAGNQEQLDQLRDMGIRLMTMADGRIQLLHTAAEALNPQLAEEGLQFMQEMIELSKNQPQDTQNDPMLIKVMAGEKNNPIFRAGPAHFGYDLKSRPNIRGKLAIGEPYKMCNSQVVNPQELAGRIAIIERGDCMFIDKARNLQRVGAIGGIVIDHTPGTAATNNPLFAMSGDSNRDDVYIPLLFIFHTEGQTLLELLAKNPDLEVVMAARFDVLGPDIPVSPGSPTDQSETSTQSPDTVGQSESSIQSPQSGAGTQSDDIQPHQPNARSTIQLNKMVTVVDGVYQSQEDIASTIKPVHLIEDNDGIINIRTMTDGSKQVFFRFDKMIKDKSSVTLEDIYLKLRDTLLEKTNFKLLDKQSDYLTAVVKLLESVYYGKQNTDQRTEELFQELSNELEILSPQQLEAAQKQKDEEADEEKKSVHHFTIDVSEIQNSEEGFKIIQQDGMNIKIKTKIVKPVPERDPIPDEVIQHTRHYADRSDFEESEPTIIKKKVDTVVEEVKKGDEYLASIESRESVMQKLKEQVLGENPGKFNEENNKKEPIQDEIGFDLLAENINPDLAEGLISVIQNSEQRTLNAHQEIGNGDKKTDSNIPVHSVVKELPKYEKPVFEKTVRSLKSSDTKSTSSGNSAIDERKDSETNVSENPSSSSNDAGQSSRKSGEL